MKEYKKQARYDSEFKESSVKLALRNDHPVSQTAEELGINVNTLHTWINKYRNKGGLSTKKTEDPHLYDQLKDLRKENRRLVEERDILKKAAAYFARESM
jgi:transposase